jgi:signal transduction histidine kinase
MRQTTGNLFEAEGLSLSFHTPAEEELERFELGPNERRHLFHVFQEAATNAARHSRASAVDIEIRLQGSDLWIVVADDGLGFEPEVAAQGHGLAGMRERARALRAELSIESSPGRGTRVVLHLRTHGRKFRPGHMFM